MKTTAVSMVKDEADVIEATVRNMAAQVDDIIVADNGSVDGTRDILDRLAGELPLTVLDDPDPAYMQSDKMTRLAHVAGERGADWIVPFDADEWWYCTGRPVREVLNAAGAAIAAVTAELFDHVCTGIDPPDPNPVTRMTWRRKGALSLPKVACRYRPNLRIHQGNHGCDYDRIAPAVQPLLVVRHFPYRSVDQFLRKVRNGAAAYRAAGDRIPEDAGAHWRQWGEIYDNEGEDAVAAIFFDWYYREDPRVPIHILGERQGPLINDPAPGS